MKNIQEKVVYVRMGLAQWRLGSSPRSLVVISDHLMEKQLWVESYKTTSSNIEKVFLSHWF